MKRIVFCLIFLFFIAKPSFAQNDIPQPNYENITAEHIKNFESNIKIRKDGSIDVVEKIDYFFNIPKHGIFRNIPFTKYDNKTRYDIGYNFLSVTDENNKSYRYEKSKNGEQWVLKIGDPDKIVTGNKTYIISYKVKGILGYFEDHDELYWNTTGNGWDIPIRNAKTTIFFPQKLSEKDIQLKCFTGDYQSTESNCVSSTDGQLTTFQTTLLLNPNEGLTVVFGFPKNMIAVLLPEKFIPFFETFWGKVTLVVIALIALFWYIILPIVIVINWYKNGRDPDVGRPVTAWFDPPIGSGNRKLTPSETGSLLDETVETRDIFSSIVHLAQRGYLTIEETAKKDFTLHFINKPKKGDLLLPFEQKLLDGIFKDGNDARLKDTKLYETIPEIKTTLYESMVKDDFFKKNPNTTRIIYYVLGFFAFFTFNLVLAFISFFFGRIMPKKTLFGAQQTSIAKGLRNFLSSQERQLNFQGDRQMLFEKLLPFAIAFGVEKAWAKRFEDFDLKNPEWYQGSPDSNFNSMLFASSLHNSYNNFAVSATPPASSSSGFGGGGFSGGGGGGGGGGSW